MKLFHSSILFFAILLLCLASTSEALRGRKQARRLKKIRRQIHSTLMTKQNSSSTSLSQSQSSSSSQSTLVPLKFSSTSFPLSSTSLSDSSLEENPKPKSFRKLSKAKILRSTNNNLNNRSTPIRFECASKSIGYYADVDFQCRIFHICDNFGRRIPMHCPPGTAFNQMYRVCDWPDNVDCSDSPTWFYLNDLTYPKESKLESENGRVTRSLNSIQEQNDINQELDNVYNDVKNNIQIQNKIFHQETNYELAGSESFIGPRLPK